MRRQMNSAAEQTKMNEETSAMDSEQDDQHVTGRGWHGDPEGHAAAGRKGGRKVAQDRAHMAEIGRRGGAKVAQDRAHMAEIGRRGGAKVSQDRSHMAEIGKKGGESK
jgi:general stress protein YciG